MKTERPWSWRILKNDFVKNQINALIVSADGKSQLQLENVNPELVDTITSLLTSSYKWGAAEAESNIENVVDRHREDLQPSDEDVDKMVQAAISPLLEEIAELKEQKIKDSQSIGGLKGQLTKLKAKLDQKN